MKRKFLVGLAAVVTALCMMFGIAACGETDFTFEPVDNGYIVTAYSGTETRIVIPAKHDGKPVIAIASRAFFEGALTSITIPDSVISIGEAAFLDCKGLQSVSFENNSKLTSIVIYAFAYCNSLHSITIPEGVKSIGGAAFSGCSSLPSITIPSSVTEIGWEAFRSCSGLQSVTFGDNSKLTTIEKEAFFGCSWLQNITIPASVASIGENVFKYCSGLTEIRYNGTIDAWGRIDKDSSWDGGYTGDYTVYCTDGTVAKDGTETKN